MKFYFRWCDTVTDELNDHDAISHYTILEFKLNHVEADFSTAMLCLGVEGFDTSQINLEQEGCIQRSYDGGYQTLFRGRVVRWEFCGSYRLRFFLSSNTARAQDNLERLINAHSMRMGHHRVIFPSHTVEGTLKSILRTQDKRLYICPKTGEVSSEDFWGDPYQAISLYEKPKLVSLKESLVGELQGSLEFSWVQRVDCIHDVTLKTQTYSAASVSIIWPRVGQLVGGKNCTVLDSTCTISEGGFDTSNNGELFERYRLSGKVKLRFLMDIPRREVCNFFVGKADPSCQQEASFLRLPTVNFMRVLLWKPFKQYFVGEYCLYDKKTYRCAKKHVSKTFSLLNWHETSGEFNQNQDSFLQSSYGKEVLAYLADYLGYYWLDQQAKLVVTVEIPLEIGCQISVRECVKLASLSYASSLVGKVTEVNLIADSSPGGRKAVLTIIVPLETQIIGDILKDKDLTSEDSRAVHHDTLPLSGIHHKIHSLKDVTSVPPIDKLLPNIGFDNDYAKQMEQLNNVRKNKKSKIILMENRTRLRTSQHFSLEESEATHIVMMEVTCHAQAAYAASVASNFYSHGFDYLDDLEKNDDGKEISTT